MAPVLDIHYAALFCLGIFWEGFLEIQLLEGEEEVMNRSSYSLNDNTLLTRNNLKHYYITLVYYTVSIIDFSYCVWLNNYY